MNILLVPTRNHGKNVVFLKNNLVRAFQKKKNAHPQRRKVPPFSKGVIMHGNEPLPIILHEEISARFLTWP